MLGKGAAIYNAVASADFQSGISTIGSAFAKVDINSLSSLASLVTPDSLNAISSVSDTLSQSAGNLGSIGNMVGVEVPGLQAAQTWLGMTAFTTKFGANISKLAGLPGRFTNQASNIPAIGEKSAANAEKGPVINDWDELQFKPGIKAAHWSGSILKWGKKAWEHVEKRHIRTDIPNFAHKSKFKPGLNVKNLAEDVRSTGVRGKNGNYITYEKTYANPIGANGEKSVRLVTQADGVTVKTLFPTLSVGAMLLNAFNEYGGYVIDFFNPLDAGEAI